MPVYRPSELSALLRSLGIHPRKGLSQNFLIDGNITKRIVKSLAVQKEDVIIEIGSGPGALTEALLASGCHVIAVELDAIFAKALERLQTPDNRLTILPRDALSLTLEEILSDCSLGEGQKVKIAGNLPYHITTPLLERFIHSYPTVERIVAMVQEEVARRITARPHTAAYSSLTLFLRFYAEPSYEFTVGKRCFYPVPKVDSAVVKFLLKSPPEIEAPRFFALTRKAFGQRRKSLRSSLKALYETSYIEEALEKMEVSSLARPEELSFEQFLELYQLLNRPLS
jgi:16S rRNA (adenine1518-N6/adenine1519-N6)-dimethyltransferase